MKKIIRLLLVMLLILTSFTQMTKSIEAIGPEGIITDVELKHNNGETHEENGTWYFWETIQVTYSFDLGYPLKLDDTYQLDLKLPSAFRPEYSSDQTIIIPMTLPDGTSVKLATVTISKNGNISVKFEKEVVDKYNDIKGSFTFGAKFSETYNGEDVDFETESFIDFDYKPNDGSGAPATGQATKSGNVVDISDGYLKWVVKLDIEKGTTLQNLVLTDELSNGIHAFQPYFSGIDPGLTGTGTGVFAETPWEKFPSWDSSFENKNMVKVVIRDETATGGEISFKEITPLTTDKFGGILSFKVDIGELVGTDHIPELFVTYYTKITDFDKQLFENVARFDGTDYTNSVRGEIDFWSDAGATGKYRIVELNKVDENGELILLSDIQFRLEKKQNNVWGFYRDITIGHTGVFKIPLVNGEYRLIEVKAPGGYVLNTQPHEFIVDGSTSSTEPIKLQIENIKVPTKDLSVTKKWIDGGTQPVDNIQAIIYQVDMNNVKTEYFKVRLTKDNNWTITLKDLPVFNEQGSPVTYEVKEVDVPGYISESSITDEPSGLIVVTITNTELTSIGGTKTWNHNENPVENQPKSIVVNLMNGDTIVDTKTVKASDSWKYEFKDIKKYDENNVEINYTIQEETVVDYETSYQGYDITNTYTPPVVPTVDVTGTKTWVDDNDSAGLRPTSITVNLLKNGTKIDSVEVKADDGWKYSFTGLPKQENGQDIVYSVSEETVDKYDTSYQGYDITNTYTPPVVPTVDVTGTKTWVDDNDAAGLRPTSITVNLLKNGTKIDSVVVKADDGWKYSFTGLPKQENGQDIVYTVSEETVDKYDTSYQGYDITNTYTQPVVPTVDVTGTKTWVDDNDAAGLRPTSITVNLLKNGTKIDSVEVKADNGWKYSFTGLPKQENGQDIVYTVSEDTVDKYDTSYQGYNITNTYTPPVVPTDPEVPVDPTDPEVPVVPIDPEVPVVPSNPETPKLPETGIDSNYLSEYVVVIGVLFICLNAVIKYKKELKKF